MSVENKQVRGDASVSRNVNAGGNARVQGNMHVGHNLRVDGAVEARNIKAANKGLFLDEAQLKARYPQPEEGWFAGVGSSSPFVVYIARNGEWQRTTGTFSVDMDMDSYNQRIDELENQVAELIEIILSGGGGNVVNVRVSVEGHGSVTGSGLYQIGNPVTLTATADNGYHFVEWQDAEGNTIAGAGATYTFEASESVTLKAVFAVSYYTVSATPNDSTLGSVSVSPAVPAGQSGYTYGTQLTLTATAETQLRNAYFVRWDDGNTENPRDITLTGNKILTAVFAEVAVVATEIDAQSMGTGEITATVTRGGVEVARTDVRIGDHVLIRLTGTSKKPSSLTAGGVEVQCTSEQDGKVWKYGFDYSGSESLTFTATFSGEPITVSYSIEVEANNSAYGNVHIEVDGENVGTQKNIPDGTGINLVAVPKTGFVFDTENGWKKGSVVIGTGLRAEITVSSTTAGKYTAYFKHEGEPDFYYGAVNTPNVGEYAADYTGLSSMLASGYLVDNNKATINGVTYGKTFIYLYDAAKVTPNRVRVIPVGYEQYASDFSGEEIFDTATFHIKNNVVINGTTYTAIELLNGNESEGSEMRAEITFTANNNSQE